MDSLQMWITSCQKVNKGVCVEEWFQKDMAFSLIYKMYPPTYRAQDINPVFGVRTCTVGPLLLSDGLRPQLSSCLSRIQQSAFYRGNVL